MGENAIFKILQERLTQEIAQSIQAVTDAKGVAVIIEAQHLCMMMRGVEKQNSKMKTSVMLGKFRSDDRTRNELWKTGIGFPFRDQHNLPVHSRHLTQHALMADWSLIAREFAEPSSWRNRK